MKEKFRIVVAAVIGLLGVIGWFSNVIDLFRHGASMSTVQLVIRIIGVPVLPVGALMGWFG